ncbi:hypothetical protein HDU67_006963 [Dinochytrium kinnereticum]|nr:hypothetical protein HDU67_006963 [Dinochytrium kinnereticum]
MDEILYYVGPKENLGLTCKSLNIAAKNHAKRALVVENVRRDRRKRMLAHALSDHGLELSSESKLCKDYIDNNLGKLHDIVNVVVETDWFVRCTWFPKEERYSEEAAYPGYYSSLAHIAYELVNHKSRIMKHLALFAWCRARNSQRSPKFDPPSPQRPPEMLWPWIDKCLSGTRDEV